MKYNLKKCRSIFNSIMYPNFRQWKIKLKDGTFIQNRTKIASPEKLYSFMKGFDINAVYISTSFYFRPQTVRGNLKKVSEYLYLWSELYFDFDGSMAQTQKDALKIKKIMEKEKNYNLINIQFSGTQGLHLVYEMVKRSKIKGTQRRFNFYKKELKRINDKAKKLKLKTFDGITKDIFRVYAAPNSYKKINMVTKLNEEELSKNIYKVLKSHNIILREPKGDDDLGGRLKHRGKERAEVSSFRFKYLDNVVKGVKGNYVTLLEHYKRRFNANVLKMIQQKYNLSDFYIFEVGDRIYSLNLKCLQRRRLIKVLKKSNSLNLNTFSNLSHLPIIITNIKSKDKVVSKIKLINVIKSDYGLNDLHSKPHCNFFDVKYLNMIGDENIKTYEMIRNG